MNRTLPLAVHQDVTRVGREVAALLAGLAPNHREAAALRIVVYAIEELKGNERAFAEELTTILSALSSLSMKSSPVPPEVIADTMATFNEAEIIEAIQEIRNGKGRRLEDIMPELLKAADLPTDTTIS